MAKSSFEPREASARTRPLPFRLLLAAVTALVLAGCATGPRVINQKSQLSPRDSFIAMPPGGPAIVGVLEKKYKDAVVRESILANNARVSGQNFIHATLYGPVGYRTVQDNALGPDRIGPDQIHKEFGWYLTGVSMQRSQLYAQNKYGPFGFAIGTARTGDRCIYAWQHIGRHQDTFLMRVGAIGIRLRFCDRRMTIQQLLALMYDFTIVGYLPSPAWDPYGRPPKVSEDLGGLSAPIRPAIETRPAPVKPARTATVRQKAPEPVIRGPIVPPPTPAGIGGYGTVPAPTPSLVPR